MPTITDWLMVAITIVYVIATIAICRANMQSAKASKVDNALLPEWKNTRMYEAKIVVPKGTTLNIGKVGEQIIKETGTVLTGSNDQILLPLGWNLEWIQEIQIVPN